MSNMDEEMKTTIREEVGTIIDKRFNDLSSKMDFIVKLLGEKK